MTIINNRQGYRPVESAAIVVVARELGTNILRSKVAPKSEHAMRRREKEKEKEKEKGSEKPLFISDCELPDSKGWRKKQRKEVAITAVDSMGLGDVSSHLEQEDVGQVEENDYSAESDKINEEHQEEVADPVNAMELQSDFNYFVDGEEGVERTCNEDVQSSESVEADRSTNPKNQSPTKSSYLSPNEPVFTSTMKYNEMFVFWQV